MINAIHHVSMIVENTERALEFYCDVLGLEKNKSRPEMAFPGAWLQIGEAEIHLLELPNPDPVKGRPEHGGRDRHLAMCVSDLALIEAELKQAGVDYTLSKSGRRALFCRDPDGNALELIEAA
jgi:glyoxylase I family protein